MSENQPQIGSLGEILGSVLEDHDFDIGPHDGYESSMAAAKLALHRRGFQVTRSNAFGRKERERASIYINRGKDFLEKYLLQFLIERFRDLYLRCCNSENHEFYAAFVTELEELRARLNNLNFLAFISQDPRHLLILAAGKKYPQGLSGYEDSSVDIDSEIAPDGVISPMIQQTACSLLKAARLERAVQGDDLHIRDFVGLMRFFEEQGISLKNWRSFSWKHPENLPQDRNIQIIYVKIASFFEHLEKYVRWEQSKNCWIMKDANGEDIEISEIKARLKTPESILLKIGRSPDEEVRNIADLFAIAFILRKKEDTLRLYQALHASGFIHKEGVETSSVHQTLFTNEEELISAIKPRYPYLSDDEIQEIAREFFKKISPKKDANPLSDIGHKKIQMRVRYRLAVFIRESDGFVIIPGSSDWQDLTQGRISANAIDESLLMELRISNEEDWAASEYKGAAHHDAFRTRQMLAVLRRIFGKRFELTEQQNDVLNEDFGTIYQAV